MVKDFKNIISREIYCPDEKESIKIVCIMCNMKEKMLLFLTSNSGQLYPL